MNSKFRVLVVIMLISISIHVNGQTQEQKDSVINLICKIIVDNQDLSDSTRIMLAFQKHLFPFMKGYPEGQSDQLGISIYYRLQRNCKQFQDILDRINPPKGDWKVVDNKPTSRLTRKECRKFLRYRNYKYLESTGDTVNVKIKRGYWTDLFEDGTYSKLKFRWVDDSEFEIEFVESNNEVRSNFSKSGDRYRYQILDKKEGYFDMSVEIVGENRFSLFRIYY